jgi:hypothetical protein
LLHKNHNSNVYLNLLLIKDELPPQEMLKLSGKDGFLPYKTTAELIQAALNG